MTRLLILALALALALGVGLAGCYTATITKADGSEVVGLIKGADSSALIIERPARCSPAFERCYEADYQRYDACRKAHCEGPLELRLPHQQIREISHPGSTSTWVGLGLILAGAAAIVGAFYAPMSCKSDVCTNMDTALPLMISGVTAAAVGIGVSLGGLLSWRGSVARAHPR